MTACSELDRTRTKIVATIGPASCSRVQLTELIHAGVNIFRLNMAHGTPAEHEKTVFLNS